MISLLSPFISVRANINDVVPTDSLVDISGTVREKTNSGEVLMGVTISCIRDGKKFVAITDVNGKFALKVPNNSTVSFSYMGFDTRRIKVNGAKKDMKIVLAEVDRTLDEVVIMGNRRVSKANVTSAATVVKTKDLTQAPVANAMDLLQGRVAGLNISQNNGSPGSIGNISIRGVSDISVQEVSSDGGTDYVLGSSTPLFVIDGIPQEDVGDYNSQGLLSGSGVSPISSVPFEDIDNIQVLKDAAATSLYGSRGAYGVVLIETKKGSGGKPRISYSMDMKVNTPPRLRPVLVGRDERLYRIDQILQNDTSRYHGYWDVNANQALSDSLNSYYNNNTDWQDNFYRSTVNMTHNIQVNGGTPKFNYKLNGNYYSEKGIIENTDFNRYGLRTNMGYTPNEKFDMFAQMNITYGKKGAGSGNDLSQKGVASGSTASSLLPPPSIYSASNAALGALMVESGTNSISYDASIVMRYLLPWNIRFSGTFGYTYNNSEFDSFTPGLLNTYNAFVKTTSSNSNRYYVNTNLDWETWLWMFRVGFNIGVELSNSKKTDNGIILKGLPSDIIWGPVGNIASSNEGSAKVSTSDNLLSFSFAPRFSIGSKAIGDRYVFNPSLRPEATAAYSRHVKWVINPGLGLRWNFYMEPFMAKATEKWLDQGALRVSWGKTTKYKANRYDVWGTYLLGTDTYNGEQSIPIDYEALPNNGLKPITTTQWNIGGELTVFKNKLNFVADAYYKQVDNQLYSVDLPNHNAFSKINTTDVSLVNYGLELTFNVTPLSRTSPFYLSTNFNVAINKDKLTKLPNDARQIINDDATIVNLLGSNSLSNYLYVYKGVYATDEDVPVDPATGRRLRVGGTDKATADNPDAYFRAGDPIWADLNGDYIIDERDKKIVGNSQPQITGGLSVNFRYKNVSLFTSFSFVLKRDIINKVLADNFASYKNPTMSNGTGMGKDAALIPIGEYNFWTKDNIHADYPNPYDYQRAELINPFRADQTLFMEDGSYFKINGVTLQWQIPARWLRSLRIGSASLRANVNNIYTFSKYSGINPENVNSLGQDTSGGYPSARSFSFGLYLSL